MGSPPLDDAEHLSALERSHRRARNDKNSWDYGPSLLSYQTPQLD